MNYKLVVLIVIGVAVIAYLLIWTFAEDRGSPRFFNDQAYYFETLRTLSGCPFGAADVGEVYATIKHVRSGKEQEWYEAWERTAQRIDSRAARLQDPTSRGLAYFRAHNYYRSAEFFLLANDPKRAESYQKAISTFYKGLESLNVKYEIIDVPYEQHALRAVYYPGPAGADKKPLLVASPGFDAIQEELYFRLVAAAHQRGYSVLTSDGPGQGNALRKYNLKFTPEWEKPVRAVLDSFFKGHQRPPAVVLFGESFGGYLAPRAAAFTEGIDGVVAYDVFFDFQEVFLNRSPSMIRGLLRRMLDNQMDGTVGLFVRLKALMDPSMRWSLANTRWTMGDGEPAELYRRFGAYSLKKVADRIKSHVLILAGKNDHFIPLKQVEDFQKSLVNAKSVATFIYSEETGGDQHCQMGAALLWHEDFFDWLKNKFPTL